MSQTLEKLKAEGKIPEIIDLFPIQGKWTERDYFHLPETNRIMELSEGRLIIPPSPTTEHQRILSRLFLLMGNHVLSNNLGEVFVSPIDVRLWPGTIRQPDIVFMSNEHKDRITAKYWGVPDLAVEVISEGTERQDRMDKFGEYQKAGVTEYWIVDPSEQIIEVFALEKGAYTLLGKWKSGEMVYSRVLVGFQIAIESILG